MRWVHHAVNLKILPRTADRIAVMTIYRGSNTPTSIAVAMIIKNLPHLQNPGAAMTGRHIT
jgi:hypothetical protein